MNLKATTLVFLWILGTSRFVDAQDRVTIEFAVHVPDDTPKNATISICGNAPSLGSWQPPGLELTRDEAGLHRGTAELAVGTYVEFKVTQGSWATVEKDADGLEIDNRNFDVADQMDTIVVTVASWSSADAIDQPSTITGTMHRIDAFPSTHLERPRDVYIYVPPGYGTDRDVRYPVLYMHDGQNLFDEALAFRRREWNADEAAESLISAGRVKPFIIVGVCNTAARIREYTPVSDSRFGSSHEPLGDAYGRFLVEELKPFIDDAYQTLPGREHTGVAGSSLGGLISLYLCMQHPDVFSRCGVISPSLSWGDDWILKACERPEAAEWMKNVRFWVDMGTMEFRQGEDGLDHATTGIKSTRRLIRAFDRAGLVPGRDYYYAEVAGGQHNEPAWSQRFRSIILYFYGW